MKISIITVVYNNVNNITTAIDSVLNQTYKDIDYIIIDGGSNDGTVEKIKPLINNNTRFISEPDKGIYYAINKGIALSEGEVIGILHSDDIFNDNEIIQKIADTFKVGDYDAVYGDLVYVSKYNTEKVIRYWKSSQFEVTNFKKGWMPAHPTLFMKKTVYDNFGIFNTEFKIASDYDFMLRTLGSGKLNCYYLPLVITKMRTGGASNKSIKNIWSKSYEDWSAIRKNKVGGIIVLLRKNTSKLKQFIFKHTYS